MSNKPPRGASELAHISTSSTYFPVQTASACSHRHLINMTPLLWQSRRLGMATCLQALLWITAAVLLSLAVLALVRRDGRSVNAVLAPALSVQISTTTTTSKTSSSRSSGQHASSKGTIIAEHRPDIVIPNLVHFVYLLDETAVTDESRLPLTFRHWLAVYAAHRRLQPDRILLWTNVDVHVLRRNHMGAQRSSTDSDVDSDVDSDIIDWAVRILAIPGVELRHTTAPTHVHTTTNHPLPIRFPENRSDFVRTRIMHEHGGIYLDFDAYILRDVHALRKSGFATVVGRQMDGRVGCGMFLGRAGTRLSRAYSELQDEGM